MIPQIPELREVKFCQKTGHNNKDLFFNWRRFWISQNHKASRHRTASQNNEFNFCQPLGRKSRNHLRQVLLFIWLFLIGTSSRRWITSWGKVPPKQFHCYKPWVHSPGWPHFSNFQCNSINHPLYRIPSRWGHHQLRPSTQTYCSWKCLNLFFTHFCTLHYKQRQAPSTPRTRKHRYWGTTRNHAIIFSHPH